MALCLIVVAALLAGCRGGGVAGDTRLLAIDSIVDTDSVAAWRQLQAVDSASLTTDADRHLYALLHQQILYKQYQQPDTVVLATLRDYYGAHPDGNRLTRALLLSGGACEDAGRLAEAMTWYKRAEAEADTADYRSLAQANLRQGFLYYRNYADHHIIKQKLENAAYYYEQLGDSAYLAITLECLGAVYRTVNHGQAHATLERAARLALKAGNEATYVASNEKLARCLLTDSLPGEALEIIEECERHDTKQYITDDCCYTASQSLSMLGRPDEALAYLRRATPPSSTYTRMMNALCLMKIHEARGDNAQAMKQSKVYEFCADSLRNAPVVSTIFETERDIDDSSRLTLQSSLGQSTKTIVVLACLAGILLLAIILFYLYRRRRYRREMNALKKEVEAQAELLEELAKKEGSQRPRRKVISSSTIGSGFATQVVTNYLVGLRKLLVMNAEMSPAQFKKEFQQFSDEIAAEDTFWEGLFDYVNEQSGGQMQRWEQDYPQLNEKDLKMLALMFAGFGYMESASLLGYTSTSMSMHRKRVAKKMGLAGSLIKHVDEVRRHAMDKR